MEQNRNLGPKYAIRVGDPWVAQRHGPVLHLRTSSKGRVGLPRLGALAQYAAHRAGAEAPLRAMRQPRGPYAFGDNGAEELTWRGPAAAEAR